MNDGQPCTSAASVSAELKERSTDQRAAPRRRICRAVRFVLPVILGTRALIGAETTMYFAGHAVSVPPPVVLLVCGFALLTVGSWFRTWLE